MRNYLDLLQKIMDEGDDRMSRNAMTRMLFAYPLRFNLQDGFPAVTTKKLAFKAMKAELLWFIEGSGDDNRLKELTGTDKTIWTDNAEAPYWKPKAKFPGDLGRIYGVQWRNWRTADGREVDQLTDVIERLKKNPYDRRLIVTAWNPGELDDMALPPCHVFFHLAVFKGKVSLHMYQRSCDMFLGVPFNIASYALLLSMIAHAANMEPYELVITFGDAHIYHDHFDAVKQQLTREPLPLPKLWLNPEVRDIDKFTMDDIRIDNYTSHPAIKAQMIV